MKTVFFPIILVAALLAGCQTEIEVPEGLPGSIEERPNLTPSSGDTIIESSGTNTASPGMVFGACNAEGMTIYYRLLTPTTCEVVRGEEFAVDHAPYSGQIVIPEKVEYGGERLTVVAIAERAFEYSEVTEVSLPSTLTSIGAYAFQYSTQLRQLVIPGGVERLQICVCRGCTGLRSVTLLNGVVYIGKLAFTKCTQLTEVRLPGSLGVIDVGAFLGCSALSEIDIPQYIGLINDYAFSRCGLTSFSFPDKVTTLSEGVFQNCTELSALNLPSQLSEVECYALAGCEALEHITLPATVSLIGTQAFAFCTNLKTVRTMSTTPPVCADDSFDGLPSMDITLEVPASSLNAYLEAPVWQQFQQIIIF